MCVLFSAFRFSLLCIFSGRSFVFAFPLFSVFLFSGGGHTFIRLLDLGLFPEVHSIRCFVRNLLEVPELTMAFRFVLVGRCSLFPHRIFVYWDQWVTHIPHVLLEVYVLVFHTLVVLVPISVVLQCRGIGSLSFCV